MFRILSKMCTRFSFSKGSLTIKELFLLLLHVPTSISKSTELKSLKKKWL